MANEVTWGVRLRGDSRGAVQAMSTTRGQLDKLDREMRQTAKRTQTLGSGFARWAKSTLDVRAALAGVAAALSAGALTQGIGRVFDQLEDVQRTATALGTSTDSVQELTHAFRQFRLDSDDVSDALNTLADRSQDAIDGTKSMVDDFALLGITVDDLRGKRPDELFELMARRVAQIEDPTARAAAVVRTFGDDLGRRLLPLLIQGADGLNKYEQAAHDLGLVVDEDLVASSARAAQEFRNVRAQINAQFVQVVADNAAQLMELARSLGDIAEAATRAASGFVNFGKSVGDAAARATGARTLEDQLADAVKKRDTLLGELRYRRMTGGESEFAQRAEEALLEQINAANAEVTRIERLVETYVRPRATGPSASASVRTAPIGVTASPPSSRDTGSGETEHVFDPEAGFHAAVDQARFEKFFEVPNKELDELEKKSDETFQQLSVFARQAGRNMQDAFAQFLFDPFEGGLKGMLESFTVTIQRMAAQAASAAIFDSLTGGKGGGISGFFSSALNLFSSSASSAAPAGKAAGGPVAAGVPYLVGERGPELFMPRMSGAITPNHALGGDVIVNVHNNSQAQANASSRRGPDGRQMIDIMVEDSFNRLLTDGRLDKSLAANIGARRPGRF